MHLIYRSKKQALPMVPQHNLDSYMPTSHTPSFSHFSKRSRHPHQDSHQKNRSPHFLSINPALVYNVQPRRTLYRPSRTRKAESGYLKASQVVEQNQLINRNKSTQMVQHEIGHRRRGQSEFSPYQLGQKKTHSTSKFKAVGEEVSGQLQRDWICQGLIQRQVYGIDEESDFS